MKTKHVAIFLIFLLFASNAQAQNQSTNQYEYLGAAADFFGNFNTLLNESLIQNVQNYFNKVSTTWMGVLAGMMLLYTTIAGFMVMFGKANTDDVLWTFAKFTVVTLIIGGWTNFYQYVADPILNIIPNTISTMFGSNGDDTILSFANTSIAQVIQTLGQVEGIAQTAAVSIFCLINICATAACVVLYFFIASYVKVVLAILIVIAPIFLGFSLFQSTRGWAFNWLNLVVSKLLTLLILQLTVLFIGSLVALVVQQLYGTAGSQTGGVIPTSTLTGCLVILFSSVFMWLFIRSAGDVASNLTSGGFNIMSGGIRGISTRMETTAAAPIKAVTKAIKQRK